MKKLFSSILLATAMLLAAASAHAEVFTSVTPENAVLTGFLSKHLTNNEASWAAPAAGFREQNWGVGVRYKGYAVGGYKNSLNNDSVYVAKEFQWSLMGLSWLRTGVVLGAVTGYDWKVTPLVLPEPLILKVGHAELASLVIPAIQGKTPYVLAAQLRITF